MLSKDEKLDTEKLRVWLRTLADEKSSNEITYHLADLYSACQNLIDIIERMHTLSAKDSKLLRRTLNDIYGEMYERMIPNHMLPLQPIFKRVVSQLYNEAEEANEPGWDVPEGG